VASSGAGAACPDLPFCRGATVIPADAGALFHMLHRGWAVVVAALVLATAAAARRVGGRSIVVAADLAAALVVLQVALGVLNIATRLAPIVRGAHLGVATLLFGTLVVLGAMSAANRATALGRLPGRATAPRPTTLGG